MGMGRPQGGSPKEPRLLVPAERAGHRVRVGASDPDLEEELKKPRRSHSCQRSETSPLALAAQNTEDIE